MDADQSGPRAGSDMTGESLPERAALQAYYSEAASWDADRARLAARSEQRAWRVAAGAALIALMLALALVQLLPLKRVEPFLIRVDNATGIVDTVPAYDSTRTPDELVSRYFVSRYVKLRERFSMANAEQDYYEVAALSSPPVGSEWVALWARGNPRSPLERFRDGTSVRIEVRAVSFFERGSGVRDLAQVRFARFTRAGSGGAETPSYFIATVQFAYGRPSSDVQQRQWNPLGFRVTDYRVDAEAPPETSPQPNGGRS
jgi:type IV secretion system protein VirB8